MSAVKVYLAGNPDIRLLSRESWHSSKRAVHPLWRHEWSVSNSGDKYIRSHNMLSVPCVPGWVPVGDSWSGVGHNLGCGKTTSVCEPCRWRNGKHSHDLIGTKPSCHGDYSKHLAPGFLTVWSEGEKGGGWREAGKTIQRCGEIADLVKWNIILEKWKFEKSSSCVC